ncbi:MAG: DUF5060 domain-containing protein, partial [Verrucomicrobiota bacterium]
MKPNAYLISILILLASITQPLEAILYEETDGYVVLEAENPTSGGVGNQKWLLFNEPIPIDPFDQSQDDGSFYRNDATHGGSYIKSNINRITQIEEGRLSYNFTINTEGTYRFVMRGNMVGEEEGHDAINDIWIRLDGINGTDAPPMVDEDPDNPTEWEYNQWYKAYTLNWTRRQANPSEDFTNIWHWEAKRDIDNTFDYYLAPGDYNLRIAPRAKDFALDRMVLYRLAEDGDELTTPSFNYLNGLGFVPSKAKQRNLDKLGYPTVSGELQQWHKTTIDIKGPYGDEDGTTNPFTDYRLTVTFNHPDSGTTITVPGYFAADGNAANTSATAGDIWKTHFLPNKTGAWSYQIDFITGSNVAIDPAEPSTAVTNLDGLKASFTIIASDKTGADFRSPEKGKLLYTGEAYPVWQGGGGTFLKAEANVPEVFLAYAEFDNSGGSAARTYITHQPEWVAGDPTWDTPASPGTPRGQGIIGAINYLASIGVNCQYFLT